MSITYKWRKWHCKWSHSSWVTCFNKPHKNSKLIGWCNAKCEMLLFCVKTVVKSRTIWNSLCLFFSVLLSLHLNTSFWLCYLTLCVHTVPTYRSTDSVLTTSIHEYNSLFLMKVEMVHGYSVVKCIYLCLWFYNCNLGISSATDMTKTAAIGMDSCR